MDFRGLGLKIAMMQPNDTANTGLMHADITEKIIGVFFEVYNELGPGFLESVYEQAMAIALSDAGLRVQRQVAVPVYFRGQRIGDYKADVTVAEVVLLELKVVDVLAPPHHAQLIHYLRATPLEVGLLLNFGPKATFKRIVVSNESKKIRLNLSKSAVSS
jgi:GxxExxY protein